MICGGDELSRTQKGNNNAYCQDNEISWTDWTLTGESRAFLEFARRAARLMRDHPALRRRRFFQGRRLRGAEVKDIMWLSPSGVEITDAEWNADHVKCLGVRLAGDAIGELDEQGTPIIGDSLLYLLNAAPDAVPFTLSSFVVRPRWQCVLDTFDERRVGHVFDGGAWYPLAEHSLAVFVLADYGTGRRR
jgi:glycogen operon protein